MDTSGRNNRGFIEGRSVLHGDLKVATGGQPAGTMLNQRFGHGPNRVDHACAESTKWLSLHVEPQSDASPTLLRRVSPTYRCGVKWQQDECQRGNFPGHADIVCADGAAAGLIVPRTYSPCQKFLGRAKS